MDEDTLETSKIQYSSKREHTLNNSIPNKAIRFYSNNNDNNFDTLESYANLLNLEISPETRRGYRSFERQYRLSTSTQLANASQSYFEDANNFIGNSSILESSIPLRLGKICSNLEANISNLEVSYLYPLKEDKKADKKEDKKADKKADKKEDKKADKKEDKKADNSSVFRQFLYAVLEGALTGLGG